MSLDPPPFRLASPSACLVCAAWTAAAACSGISGELASRETSSLQDRIVLLPGDAQAVSPSLAGYTEDSAATAAGKQLFAWYNCAGCHAPEGGGGMGPPLSDDEWIYGSEPASVFETIARGRPKGMPTWAGRIPNRQILQLVAYVRSLGAEPPSELIAPESLADDKTDAEADR